MEGWVKKERKSKMTEREEMKQRIINRIIMLRKSGISVESIVKTTGYAKSTVYKILNENNQ